MTSVHTKYERSFFHMNGFQNGALDSSDENEHNILLSADSHSTWNSFIVFNFYSSRSLHQIIFWNFHQLCTFIVVVWNFHLSPCRFGQNAAAGCVNINYYLAPVVSFFNIYEWNSTNRYFQVLSVNKNWQLTATLSISLSLYYYSPFWILLRL